MKKAIIISCLFISSLVSVSCSVEESGASNDPIENVNLLKPIKSIEIEILALINEYRISNGLSELQQNEHIRSQTYNHTNYMIINNLPSHDNFFKRKDYLTTFTNAVHVSENVAYGYSSPRSVVNAWLDSDSHRLNIEGDHTHFNITAEQNGNNKWYFTNIFIKINN